jgi:hypothetical protein
MPKAFLDLIVSQHPLPNGYRSSQPPRRCDNVTHTIKTKTHKKHRKRKNEAQEIRHTTGQTTQTNPKPTRTSIQPPRWQHNVPHTNNNTRLTASPLDLSQPTYKQMCERQKGAVKRGQNKNQRPEIQFWTILKPRLKTVIKKSKPKSPPIYPKRIQNAIQISLRDLFRQLETLVQNHTETQLKLHQNDIKIYKPITRCSANTKIDTLERQKRHYFRLIQQYSYVDKHIDLVLYMKNDHSALCKRNCLQLESKRHEAGWCREQ